MSDREAGELTRARARVMRWVAHYTRGLPADIADGRREELLADIHDQAAESSAARIPAATVARAVVLRAFKGAPADLAWRHAQLRLAPAVGPMRSAGLLVAAAACAALMVVFGAVTAMRALHVGTGSWTPWSTEPAFTAVAVGTVAATCALVMLARSRTRFLGALWLVGAAQLLIVPGLALLSATSTVLAWAHDTQPALQSCALGVGIGVSLFCLAAAIAWAPALRRERASS